MKSGQVHARQRSNAFSTLYGVRELAGRKRSRSTGWAHVLRGISRAARSNGRTYLLRVADGDKRKNRRAVPRKKGEGERKTNREQNGRTPQVVTIGHRTYTNPTTDFPRRRRYAGTLDAKFLGQDAQRFSYLWSERPAA